MSCFLLLGIFKAGAELFSSFADNIMGYRKYGFRPNKGENFV